MNSFSKVDKYDVFDLPSDFRAGRVYLSERLDMRRGLGATSSVGAPSMHQRFEPRLFGGGRARVRDRTSRLIAFQRVGHIVDRRKDEPKLGGRGRGVSKRVERSLRRRIYSTRVHGGKTGGKLGL